MKRIGARLLAAVVISAMVAACSSAPATPSPSPGAVTPSATSPTAAASPPPVGSASPTSSPAPTVAPTSASIVLDGSWVSPKAGATVSSDVLTLSVKPGASGPGTTTFTKVVFSGTWAGAGRKVMCTVTVPGSGGVWACKANLRGRGARPGEVTLTFDVYGEGVPTAESPDGARKITWAVPPGRPVKTALTQLEPPDFDHGDTTGSYRVDWSARAGFADAFLVYYTTQCPRPSNEANAGKPCFIAGTPVDTRQLVLLARAKGDARSVEVEVPEGECDGIGGSILLRARNAYGTSPFAIVLGAPVFWVAPGDIVC